MFLMFFLTLTDGLCCGCFIRPISCWCWCCCLDIGTSSIHWAQLSRFLHVDEDRIQPPKRCILNINTTVDNVQKHNNYVDSIGF
jgi:hypothetical protein